MLDPRARSTYISSKPFSLADSTLHYGHTVFEPIELKTSEQCGNVRHGFEGAT
jgi:hypothetical protein